MADSSSHQEPSSEPRSLARIRPIWDQLWRVTVRPVDGPAPAPPSLTIWTVVALGAVLAVWRLAILILSIIWGRLGLYNPWEGDDLHHVLSRYSLHWDSGWYLSVIRHGYSYDPETQSNIAFFPMFPYLTVFMDRFLPSGEVLAGLFVVHLALFGAILYIFQLVRIDYPEVVAWRTTFFLLAFPAAFFFSAFYTESLLLFGFAGALYHARRGQWILAGLFGVFTGLTKLIGLILIIPVGLEMLRQGALRRDNPRTWLGALLVPAGAAAYLGYLHAWLGDFRVYFWSQEQWNRQSFDPEPFLMFVRYVAGRDPGNMPYPADMMGLHTYYFLMDVGTLLLFLGAGVYLWVRLHPSYGALVLAGAMIPALSGTPLALARYMAILFPVFILLGRIESEPVRNMIAIISLFGLGFTTFLFTNGYWAG